MSQVLAVAFVSVLTAMPGAQDRWLGHLPTGSFSVGFDETGAGPNRVSYWYPAEQGGRSMDLAGYLGSEAAALQQALTGAGVPAAIVKSYVESPMLAVRRATRVTGTYPLVLVAQGNAQSTADQAVLCEYLASRGFVVATTPSPTLTTPMTSEDDIPRVAGAQADDLAAAATRIVALGGVSYETLLLVGHSFGARSALLMAMRDTRPSAIVSLDGGIGTATAVDAYRTSAGFNSAVRTRVLHFYERRDAAMTPDLALLKSLKTVALETVEMPGLGHIHFTTLGFGAAAFPAIAHATHAGDSIAADVRAMAVSTASFLQSSVRRP